MAVANVAGRHQPPVWAFLELRMVTGRIYDRELVAAMQRIELLVDQKRLAKTVPSPCVIRIPGIAKRDSLAEKVQRAALLPFDQSRALLSLRERGQSKEEIAAAFFVPC